MIDDAALKSIEKLHAMKTNGILSEAEYDEAKQKLLAGQAASPTRMQSVTTSINNPEPQDHVGWMTLALRRYAQFEGRSSRKEFWMFLLLTNIASLAILILGVVIGFAGALVLLAFGLMAVVVPLVAVQVRRFHDQGKSGWFTLLNLIPYVGAFIVLGFMLIEGAPDANEFGENPKN